MPTKEQTIRRAVQEVIDSAYSVPMVSINLTSLHNAGLDVRKIVALLTADGLFVRETGVCDAIEIRPLSSQSSNPQFWARYVMRMVNANWDKLKRDT